MFLSVRWCAEPMTQLCKLKDKVTLQGQGILRRCIWLSFVLLSCLTWLCKIVEPFETLSNSTILTKLNKKHRSMFHHSVLIKFDCFPVMIHCISEDVSARAKKKFAMYHDMLLHLRLIF